MIIDLLSMSNYVQFNIRIAQIVGLKAAVYLSQLIDINEKAIRKNKITDGFFTIDRVYITKRTTITEEEQKEIEGNLVKIGVLERSVNNDNSLLLNLNVLTSIVMSPDEELIKDISELYKPKKKRTKMDMIKDSLKKNIISLDIQIRNAYISWIDAVLDKDGFMTKQAVISAQSELDQFCKGNKNVTLKILEIAAINAYRDIKWAINTYKKDYNSSDSKSTVHVTEANKVDSSPSKSQLRKRMSDIAF